MGAARADAETVVEAVRCPASLPVHTPGATPLMPSLSSLAAGSLDPRGPVADVIADLWWWMLALGGAVFLVVIGLLVLALFRRRKPGEQGLGPPDGAPESPGPWIVNGGLVMPTVLVSVVFVLTLVAMRAMPDEAPDDALVVEVVGRQWWWDIRYPEHDVVTANEMHLPVGRPIELRLTSEDVIHSFWVPELGGKLDLLPDGVNTLVLEADEPGEYRGACAEFCGLQHANMGFVAVAEPSEEFESWLAGQRLPAVEPADETAAQGLDVFLEAGCAMCHAIQGTIADGATGPDLTHVASRLTLAAGTLPNTPEHLAEWVAGPQEIKAGVDMPDPELSDDDLALLLAYLRSLQ